MANHDLLLQALRAFTLSMGNSYDITEMCYELCDRTMEVLSTAGAGVSVADREGKIRFVTATSQHLVELEQAQEDAQQGPCVQAHRTQQIVAVSDVSQRREWSAYSSIAMQLGVNAVVGVPLANNGIRLGALNIYSAERREWSAEDLDRAGVLADMATAYLVRTSELAEARRRADQLQHALDSRVIIEQAKGVLAGEYGLTVDEAFELLRSHSRKHNIKLTDLCDGVVSMGLRIPRQADGQPLDRVGEPDLTLRRRSG